MVDHRGVSLSEQHTATFFVMAHSKICHQLLETKLDNAQVDKSSPEVAQYQLITEAV